MPLTMPVGRSPDLTDRHVIELALINEHGQPVRVFQNHRALERIGAAAGYGEADIEKRRDQIAVKSLDAIVADASAHYDRGVPAPGKPLIIEQ
jgi:hypothetical protein